jgi:hypothetical protein
MKKPQTERPAHNPIAIKAQARTFQCLHWSAGVTQRRPPPKPIRKWTAMSAQFFDLIAIAGFPPNIPSDPIIRFFSEKQKA